MSASGIVVVWDFNDHGDPGVYAITSYDEGYSVILGDTDE